MYVALKPLKVQEANGKVKTIEIGETVDVSSWGARVVRAHLNRSFIERALEKTKTEVKKAKVEDTPAPKRRGRPKKSEASKTEKTENVAELENTDTSL